jgi:hypothetical protein
MHLQGLLALKAADELWQRGLGLAIPTVILAAER